MLYIIQKEYTYLFFFFLVFQPSMEYKAKTLKGITVFASAHPFCEKSLNILYQINVLVFMKKNYRDRVTEIHVDQLITRCQNTSLILQYLVSILRRPRKICKTNKQPCKEYSFVTI